jgi:hypothetical protein
MASGISEELIYLLKPSKKAFPALFTPLRELNSKVLFPILPPLQISYCFQNFMS